MSDYRMPKAEVGDPVIWYPDGRDNEQPVAAVVTGIGERGLALAVLGKDWVAVQPQDGVRHVSDPGLRLQEVRLSGAWDYSPLYKRLKRVEALLEGKKTQ